MCILHPYHHQWSRDRWPGVFFSMLLIQTKNIKFWILATQMNPLKTRCISIKMNPMMSGSYFGSRLPPWVLCVICLNINLVMSGSSLTPDILVCFSCDQAALWTFLGIWLFVCPSAFTGHLFTMLLSPYHHDILWSNCHSQMWCLCKRSKSAVSGQGHIGQNKFCPIWLFWTITSFQRWLRNDAQSLMWHGKESLFYLSM